MAEIIALVILIAMVVIGFLNIRRYSQVARNAAVQGQFRMQEAVKKKMIPWAVVMGLGIMGLIGFFI